MYFTLLSGITRMVHAFILVETICESLHTDNFYLLKINTLCFGQSSFIPQEGPCAFWYFLHGALGEADYNARSEQPGVICVLMIKQALAVCRKHSVCNCHCSTRQDHTVLAALGGRETDAQPNGFQTFRKRMKPWNWECRSFSCNRFAQCSSILGLACGC